MVTSCMCHALISVPGTLQNGLINTNSTSMKWGGLTFQIIKGATIRITDLSNGKVIFTKSSWEVKRLLALTQNHSCPSFTLRLWSVKINKGSTTILCNWIESFIANTL